MPKVLISLLTSTPTCAGKPARNEVEYGLSKCMILDPRFDLLLLSCSYAAKKPTSPSPLAYPSETQSEGDLIEFSESHSES